MKGGASEIISLTHRLFFAATYKPKYLGRNRTNHAVGGGLSKMDRGNFIV
jgi:hypothetical protein